MKYSKIGIIGAMREEVDGLIEMIDDKKCTEIAGLNFYEGHLHKVDVVVVECGIAKVNAAMCAQILISEFKVEAIINTGVAGGLLDTMKVGDVVISSDAIQYDVDASKAGDPRGVIPRLKKSIFSADEYLSSLAYSTYIEKGGFKKGYINYTDEKLDQADREKHSVYMGRVVTGDIFVADSDYKKMLRNEFGGYCCEMEGGAIAHVAYLNEIPFVVIRAISDNADSEASITFDEFLEISTGISKKMTSLMIKNMA